MVWLTRPFGADFLFLDFNTSVTTTIFLGTTMSVRPSRHSIHWYETGDFIFRVRLSQLAHLLVNNRVILLGWPKTL
jgi:hypothetical protein